MLEKLFLRLRRYLREYFVDEFGVFLLSGNVPSTYRYNGLKDSFQTKTAKVSLENSDPPADREPQCFTAPRPCALSQWPRDQ